MSNVYLKYDQYSAEDFLCTRTKPRDVEMFMCAHCEGEIKIVEVFAEYCPHCMEYLHVVESEA